MDITNWVIIIGQPVVNPANSNEINMPVSYTYDDGTNKYSFSSVFSGVMSPENLQSLIVQNFPTYQAYVNVLLNTPVGQVDLTQLFPTPATPVSPVLAVSVAVQPASPSTALPAQ